ncbi:mitogen-activated protein kinase kinase kinase kinase 4 [Drosophila yakuba]|uniref:Uncharacterized protein n=1 Tax=Drosophila yakuba TaxID=7245 RepID=B4PSZ3_DROYA|nr:mitogen-activated protein kinase kinase kinase kinase 4 [Drosophila yakuba]EDW98680.1 uncharacterized protein Dyak_GE10656 [Drosophila yakuba]
MFPNYCFTNSARQSDYNVVKRDYTAKDSLQCKVVRHSAPSVTSAGRRRTRHRTERRRSISKSSSSRVKDSSSKSVGFRLTPVICSSEKDTRKPGGNDGESDKITSNPSNDPNRDLQDSFADFFSIIHDNVLESVQDAVQRMVSKSFEESVAKMERLSKDLQNQEAMLNKIYRDVTNKIAAQSEASLNQFKFVTQMLIDNQTVHYRALNQAKANKQRRKEEEDLERNRKLERERKRMCASKEVRNERVRKSRSSSVDLVKRSTGGEAKELVAKAPQHQLCQQQAPLVYHLYNSSTDQESTARSRQMSRSSSKHANTPDLPRQSTSLSMPDLSGRNSSNARRIIQPQHSSKFSRSSSSRSSNHRQDNIVCLPAMTYPPYVRNPPIPRRKLVRKTGQHKGR